MWLLRDSCATRREKLSDGAVQPLREKAVVAASAPGVDDIQYLRRRAAECERVDVGWRDVGRTIHDNALIVIRLRQRRAYCRDRRRGGTLTLLKQ